MNRQWLVLALLFAIGLSPLPGTRAVSEPAEGVRISRLIAELASTKFSERRQASRELDAIGAPALDALRQALTHADMETCHRARELVASIEKRLDTAAVLAPTRVRLACTDMPVPDAVAKLAGLAKIEIQIDPASKAKLAQRKITLDTGDVTFWEALDALCLKAGLIETTLQNAPKTMGTYIDFGAQGIVLPPPVKPVIMPARPAIKLLPKKPIGVQIQPQKPKLQPEKPKQAQPQKAKEAQAKEAQARKAQAKEAQAREMEAKAREEKAAKANEAQAQLKKQQAAAAAKRAAARRFIVQQVQVQAQPVPIQVQRFALVDLDVTGVQDPDLSRIVLADGKPEVVPTCYAGAFRIRARTSAGADKRSASVTFEVTAEPRQLGWNIIGKPRLEKARDSLGQLVTVILEQPPNQVVMNQWGGNLRMAAQMQLVYYGNQQPSSPLKRTVQIQIKLGEKPGKLLEDMTGRITVEAKTGPQDLIVVNNILTARGKTTRGARGGSIEVTDFIKDKDGNHRASLKTDKGRADQGSFRLVDARGVAFSVMAQHVGNINGDINGFHMQTWTFQAQKGREPARLIFSAPLTVNVDVPFTFKGLKLP